MAFRRTVLALAAVIGAAVVVAAPGAAHAAPVTIPTAVAEAIQGQGQGLCVANAESTQPSIDFPQMAGVFNSGMNAFMEAHKADRVEFVQRTIFDLSNNVTFGTDQRSYGDFLDSMSVSCQTGGCDLWKNDTTASFGARFRGFLNVTPAFAGQPVHIGFYADDAVSLVMFDKSGNAYPILTQPPNLGFPSWRMSETVTFDEPGLYPLEILYAEIGEHAALEMSYFIGTFSDFQRPYNQIPVVSLKDAGFSLFAQSAFFQTISGAPSYPDPATCKQCDRQFVGNIGNNGCDSGYYCNEAALCAPCDTAYYCGPSCSPCGGMTPFCVNVNEQYTCVTCRDDSDCKPGFSCDPEKHVCNECNEDADCQRGDTCINHSCTECATPDKCAGNSCNCCPKGSNGKKMQCLPIDKGGTPECVECTKNEDCGGKRVCDVLVGQCVDERAENEKKDCCGDDCLPCPADNPLCLPGPYGTACARCRHDKQCEDGEFCYGGQCTGCLSNRRCGTRCGACGGDTPFCLEAQRPEDASCVRCNRDDDCNGGHCNAATHTCDSSCAATCAPGTPHCDGAKCVECYADTQCPCGGTCDLGTHKCSSSCKNNGDCLGDQHCRWAEDGESKDCALGALPDNADCGGTLADLCAGNSIGARGQRSTPTGSVIALLGLGYLLRRRARRRV